MGLLDRLVGDLLAKSVGVSPRKARRLVRSAVGSRVLLAGGAALAGALISEMARGQQGAAGPSTQPAWAPPPPPEPGAPQAPAWVPPPPPAPVATAPSAPQPTPPVPPPPAPGTAAPGTESAGTAVEPVGAETDLPAPLLFAVVRTMVAAALADGALGATERTRIQERLAGGELPEAQAAQVRSELLVPAVPDELAAMVTGAAEAEVLYRFAALVLNADGGITATERAWLARLGEALDLPPGRCRELEAELFAGSR